MIPLRQPRPHTPRPFCALLAVAVTVGIVEDESPAAATCVAGTVWVVGGAATCVAGEGGNVDVAAPMPNSGAFSGLVQSRKLR